MKPSVVRKLKQFRLLCTILCIASLSATLATLYDATLLRFKLPSYTPGISMLITFIALVALLLIFGFLQGNQRQAAMKGEENSLGLLLDTFFNNISVYSFTPAVRYQLIRLLPKVGGEEASRLSRKQHSDISKLLVSDDRDLCMSALKFVARWGDAPCIPYVQRIVDERADEIYLHDEAIACLATLRERSNSLQNHHLLLRASAHPVQTNTLLRSASGTVQATPQETAQLLRPMVGQDDAPNV